MSLPFDFGDLNCVYAQIDAISEDIRLFDDRLSCIEEELAKIVALLREKHNDQQSERM